MNNSDQDWDSGLTRRSVCQVKTDAKIGFSCLNQSHDRVKFPALDLKMGAALLAVAGQGVAMGM
jgi:hypothetical protein